MKVEINKPLNVSGTKVFLLEHGYAPVVTVRDGKGNAVRSGPVAFLPLSRTATCAPLA